MKHGNSVLQSSYYAMTLKLQSFGPAMAHFLLGCWSNPANSPSVSLPKVCFCFLYVGRPSLAGWHLLSRHRVWGCERHLQQGFRTRIKLWRHTQASAIVCTISGSCCMVDNSILISARECQRHFLPLVWLKRSCSWQSFLLWWDSGLSGVSWDRC